MNSLPAKILLLLLLNYIDGLVTLHFIVQYGEEVEQNPALLFLFNLFGVETVILGKIIGVTIFGLLLFDKEYPESRWANFFVNLVLLIYIFLCVSHLVNLILY